MKSQSKKQRVVVLDNIRSVYNVGSVFRTSDALGIDKIYLCGCTPTPIDRFGRPRKDLAKVALGAEKDIASEYCLDTKEIIKKYNSTQETKIDGFSPNNVAQACRGDKKTHKGFLWEYE